MNLLLFSFIACQENSTESQNFNFQTRESNIDSTDFAPIKPSAVTEVITYQEFNERGFDFCDSLSVEVVFMYEKLIEIPPITDETTLLSSRLKNEGFVITNTSWGNWQEGPRLITYEFMNDSCLCLLLKKYSESNSSESDSLDVSEQIICGYGKEFPFDLLVP